MKRPIFSGAICCLACSVLTYYFKDGYGIICVGILLVAAVLFILNCQRYAVAVLLGLLVVFASVKVQNNIDLMDRFSGSTITLDFVATKDVSRYENYSELPVKTVTQKGIGKDVKLKLYGNIERDITAGEIFRADITVNSLKHSKYKLSNYADEIYLSAVYKKYRLHLGEDTFYTNIGNLRNYIKTSVDENFSSESSPLVKAMLLGDKSGLPQDLSENIRKSGVSHVIVVSGLHLAIIMFGIFGLLNRLVYNRYIRVAVCVLAVFAIAALCGFTMSVLRAGIMYIIAISAPLFDRDSDSLSALSLTVIIILAMSPFAVFNLSFQLSVLATFAIVSCVPPLSNFIRTKIKLKPLCAVIDICSITAIATLFTMPVVIYRFGYVSTVAIITNLLISYAVTAMLLLTFFALILFAPGFISVVAKPLFFAADIICKYVVFIIEKLSSLKYSYIKCGPYLAIISAIIAALCFAAAQCDIKLLKGKKAKCLSSMKKQ